MGMKVVAHPRMLAAAVMNTTLAAAVVPMAVMVGWAVELLMALVEAHLDSMAMLVDLEGRHFPRILSGSFWAAAAVQATPMTKPVLLVQAGVGVD